MSPRWFRRQMFGFVFVFLGVVAAIIAVGHS